MTDTDELSISITDAIWQALDAGADRSLVEDMVAQALDTWDE